LAVIHGRLYEEDLSISGAEEREDHTIRREQRVVERQRLAAIDAVTNLDRDRRV